MVRFYQCKECRDVVIPAMDREVYLNCCNGVMEEIHANTTDAAGEKHIPVVKEIENGVEISVGSVLHPSTEEHYIEWIYVELKNGGCQIRFEKNEEPRVVLPFSKSDIVAVYSYCNLHSLWKTGDLL